MNFNCITKDHPHIPAGVSMNFETPPKKYFLGEKTSYRRGFNDLRLKTSLFQLVFYLKIMFLVFLTKSFCWGHWKYASDKSDYPHKNPFSFLYFFLQGLQSIKIRQFLPLLLMWIRPVLKVAFLVIFLEESRKGVCKCLLNFVANGLKPWDWPNVYAGRSINGNISRRDMKWHHCCHWYTALVFL